MNKKFNIEKLLEVFKNVKPYQGVLIEQNQQSNTKCRVLTYEVSNFAIEFTEIINDVNKIFIIDKRCDGVIICENGEIILAELKSDITNESECKDAWKQIVVSYISTCALLYILFPNLKSFNVKIILAGCIKKEDKKFVTKKQAGYYENRISILCIRLIEKGKITLKRFPEDILKFFPVDGEIINPDIQKSNVKVIYLICDNCK